MFKIVQKLGKFVVKMYHKEADRLARESALAVKHSKALLAAADTLRAQAGARDVSALDSIQKSEAVRDKAKALGELF